MNSLADGDSVLNRSIRRVLKEAREDSDLTQEELAKQLRLTRNMVANVESGRRAVRVTELIRFSIALGVDPARLVTEMVAHSRNVAP